MKRPLQILTLRLTIAALGLLLACADASTWRLEAVRSRLQTRLDNLQANEQPRP